MHVTPIKTRPLTPPQDDLFDAIGQSLTTLSERSVVVVSSKVVGIWEGRCVPIEGIEDILKQKDELAMQEAEWYLERKETPGAFRMHTINEGVLIGSSGIDKSNGNNHLILWPEYPHKSAKRIRDWLLEQYQVEEVAVIISDSHSMPLRNGTSGVSIGYYGMEPLVDYREKKDIFGEPFQAQRLNLLDSLASAAQCVMGEGDEQTPLAVITDVPNANFTEKKPLDSLLTLRVNMDKDIFAPFFRDVGWKRGKKKHGN